MKFLPERKYEYLDECFTVGLAHRRLSIIDIKASGRQHEIVWRQDKQGWTMPLRDWVKGDIESVISREIQKNTFLNEIFNRHKIKFDDYISIPLRVFLDCIMSQESGLCSLTIEEV